MEKLEIIHEDIFKATFGKKIIDEEAVKERIEMTLVEICMIEPKDLHLYYNRTTDRGTLYFKSTKSKSIPYEPLKLSEIKKGNKKLYDVKVGIPTIMNTYLSKKNTFKNTLELIIFLFQAELEESKLEVLFDKIENSNIDDTFAEYLKTFEEGSERREDVLALMTNFLTDENIEKLTIVTNDIHFSFNIITSLIHFIDNEKKELWLLFDPASVSDLISFRLYTLLKIGVRIKVLPIKNKYPRFGLIANWTINSPKSDWRLIPKILQFKTFFFEKEVGNNYSRIIKHSHKIIPFVESIIDYDNGNPTLKIEGAKELKTHKLELTEIEPFKYIKFLNEAFNEYQNQFEDEIVVYNNVEFNFEVLDIDKLYRREKTVSLYKLLQAHRFIKKYKDKIFIFNGKGHVTFVPFSINKKAPIYPINVPFVEFNHIKKRYEVAEGYARVWILYNVYQIRTIETIVVRNIRSEFFEPSEIKLGIKAKNITEKDLDYNTNWDESHFKYSLIDVSEEEHFLESRYIEEITHRINLKEFGTLFEELSSKKIGILSETDKNFSKKLKKEIKISN